MKMEHEIKLKSEFYNRVASGEKSFEIRYNDRDYQVGDTLLFREYDKNGYIENSEQIRAEIIYITTFKQKSGYIVMGIKVLGEVT